MGRCVLKVSGFNVVIAPSPQIQVTLTGQLRDEPNPDSALSPVTSLGWSRPLAGGSGSSAVEVTAVPVGAVSEAVSTVAEPMVAAVVVGLGLSISLPLAVEVTAVSVGPVAEAISSVAKSMVAGVVVGLGVSLSLPLGNVDNASRVGDVASNSRHGSRHSVAVHAVDGGVVGVDEGLSLPLAVEVAAVSVGAVSAISEMSKSMVTAVVVGHGLRLSFSLSLPLAVVEAMSIAKPVGAVATVSKVSETVAIVGIGIGLGLRLGGSQGRQGEGEDHLHVDCWTLCAKPSH